MKLMFRKIFIFPLLIFLVFPVGVVTGIYVSLKRKLTN